MKKKSFEDIPLVWLMQNCAINVCNIEAHVSTLDGEINHVIDGHFFDENRCFLKKSPFSSIEKKHIFPTKKGWKEIKRLNKIANKKSGFKQGEWILYNAEIYQIKSLKYGNIQSISDGSSNVAGNRLNESCVKLSCKRKRLSEGILFYKRTIFNYTDQRIIYSNIYKILMNFWLELMDNCHDDEKIKVIFNKVTDFKRLIDGGFNFKLKSYERIKIRH